MTWNYSGWFCAVSHALASAMHVCLIVNRKLWSRMTYNYSGGFCIPASRALASACDLSNNPSVSFCKPLALIGGEIALPRVVLCT